MSSSNPLIQKYEELYNPKPPEPPKPVEKPKPPSLKSYDPNELKECFIKTAFEVKTGIAQIISMNMEMDTMGIHSAGAKITFEVYVRKF